MTNKVAFITGSGKKRLGYYIAESAASKGYDVAIHYNTSKAEAFQTKSQLEKLGVQAECFAADFSDPESTVKVCEDVISSFGRVDLLVTCASIWWPKSLEETTAEDLFENFTVNTVSTFLCCKVIGLQMCKQALGGSIITMGDWSMVRPYHNYSAYNLSKGSIETLTINFSNELARRNPKVRVNCVHPGPAMVPESVTEAEKQSIISHSLAGTLGKPEHIVSAVFALAENEYITGSCLAVDGGRTVSNK